MIKFFRKIRQNLLSEGKTRKYLKYAVGEIVLVVIGILIALQINNIKTKHDNRQTEKILLQSIREDLLRDTTDLQKLNSYKKDQFSGTEDMLRLFARPNPSEIDTLSFLGKMEFLLYYFTHYPANTSFDLAKSSGNLFLVTNKDLIDDLSNYYGDSELDIFLNNSKNYTTDYIGIFQQKYRLVGPIILPEIYADEEPYNFPIDEFLHDIEMENYYLIFHTHLRIGIDLTHEKIEMAKGLIEAIDLELQQF
jgi:hypothetical protein